MVDVAPIKGLSYGFGQGDAFEDSSPEFGEVVGAATFYNPLVAAYDYINRPTFPEEEGFDPAVYGREHDLWNDHYLNLGQTRSTKEFEATAARIREEQNNRKILDSAGGWGLAAEIVSGSLSPTMAIPLVGQARGVKGILQVLAYAGAAASADELALLATRETYSEEEALIGMAAGTVLGGILGGAGKYMTARERKLFEADLNGGVVGKAPLQDNGAISYTAGLGSTSETPIPVPKPSEMSAEARLGYTDAEIKLLEDIEAGKLDSSVFPPRSDDQSLSAAGRLSPRQRLDAPNIVSKLANKLLARMNLVTRLAEQTESPAAGRLALQMSDAGLRGSRNKDFIPHANEGTLEARKVEYDAITGQFILELDDAYSRHVRGDRLPEDQLQGGTIAYARQMIAPKAGKMTKDEFNEEVFRAAQTGEQHPDKNVMKAVGASRAMFDKFMEYAEEAYDFRVMEGDTVGRLFDPEGNLGPDAVNYLSHIYSEHLIGKNPIGFRNMLRDNAVVVSQRSFKKDFERFLKQRGKMERELELLSMPPDVSKAEFEKVTKQLEDVQTSDTYAYYDTERLRIQRKIREIKKANPDSEGVIPEVEELQDELRTLRDDPEIQPLLAQVKQLQADRRALNTTLGKFEDIQADLLQKAEALEELDMKALGRVLNAGGRLAKALDKISDKAQQTELNKLWKKLGAAMKKVETQDKRIVNLYGKKKKLSPTEQFQAYQKSMLFSERRAKADAQAETLMEKLETVESLDLEAQRQVLRDVQEMNNRRIRDINARRAVRENDLRVKAEEYTPERIEELRVQAENDVTNHRQAFEDKWRGKGAQDIDIERGEASFSEYADEVAEELANRIQGVDHPISGLAVLGGPRGPELARVLNIPLEIKSQFLEKDMERVARIYARRMAPDIELYRATGSVNAAPVFKAMRENFARLRSRISDSEERPKNRADYNAWVAGDSVDLREVETIPYTDAEKNAAVSKLLKKQKDTETDMEVLVTRFRHQRGVPENPDGVMFRLGRAAKQLNVARYMGSVVPSSIPDVGRPVMRFGFAKTMKHGWGQYSKGMDRIKMTREAARRMGVAWDPIMHNRVQQVMDIMDDYGHGKSLPERALGFVSNKTGLVAGFDRWTAEMKQISAGVVIAELSEGLARVVGKKAGSAKELQWYKSFLAEHGIDEQMAQRIWKQYQKEGGSDSFDDGFVLPNTEAWDDLRATRAYRAAVNRSVDSIIVTPGLDMPNWTDKNLAFSMLAQFKSFTFTSTNRVLLSGAQQADMALVNGMIFSLALGMVSYYTWAMSVGGDALKEAQKFDPDQWLDEAISRSGLLGVFAEPYEVAQRIPATQNLVTFADKRTSRRRATGLLGSALGPSYDLAEKASNVVMGLDDPTQSTVHQARLMGPWQNVFWLRQAIDAVEDGMASILKLPERRGE